MASAEANALHAPELASGSRTTTNVPTGDWSSTAILLRVVVPFSTGYFLSYYYRTVNAVLSDQLVSEFGLTAAQIGLMTAAYFLVAAIVQLPFGWALDRYGPRRLQVYCLVLAASGACFFSVATDFNTMFVARALIGIGVASALLAGMKALAMTSPGNRLGLFNGMYMCIGATGAIAATMPTTWLLQMLDWRQLFLVAALATAASAALIWMAVPRGLLPKHPATPGAPSLGYRQIFRSRDFWQLAPLSATAVGGAWALQGLWSAPWLRDVALLDQGAIAGHLMVMAGALCIGALSFGLVIHWLGKYGIAPDRLLFVAATIFILAEVAIAFAWPVPPVVPWCIVGVFASGTVMTYTISAQRFPKESVGRANSALNLLHFSAAFAVQAGIGYVISLWPRSLDGRYPPEAYEMALSALIASQIAALVVFVALQRRVPHRASCRPEPSESMRRHCHEYVW